MRKGEESFVIILNSDTKEADSINHTEFVREYTYMYRCQPATHNTKQTNPISQKR